MAAYAATVTLDSPTSIPLAVSGVRVVSGQVDITNYNPTAAEVTDITKLFRNTPSVIPNGLSANGYHVYWSRTDKSFKAYYPTATFAPKSPLIVEEAVTVASNTGTLANLPAYIVAIEVTAGGTTGPFHAIPTGETPLTVECAVTFTTGVLTFVASDAVTAVRVTYIPQMDGTPFASSNMVIDEVIVAATTPVSLANRAFAVQHVYDDTDGSRMALEPVGEQPTASGNAVVDITDTAATKVDFHTDDTGNSMKVTYLKYAGLDNANMAIGDADITLSGTDPEQYDFNNEGFYGGLVVPGLGTQCVGEATATNLELIWGGPSGTTGAGVPTWHPELNTVRTQEATAVTTLAIPWFILDPTMSGSEGITAGPGSEVAADVAVGVVDFIAMGR